MASVTSVNLLALATSAPYVNQIQAIRNASTHHLSLLSYNSAFTDSILPQNVSVTLVSNESPFNAFHEGGIYQHSTNSIYISSNYGPSNLPIRISVYDLSTGQIRNTTFPDLAAANGGTTYIPPNQLHNTTYPPYMLWCDEGSLTTPSQLLAIDPSTNTSFPLLTSFLGKPFASLNDARQHPLTGDIWFTDAYYGWYQAFRPEPVVPPQVYRFEPLTGVVQAVATDFDQSNGLEFSPDLRTLYVTDTGAQHWSANETRPATIYAFDVVGGKRLANRRVFAYSDFGFPDGIHCDTLGNVWSSTGDGVHVWNEDGVLIGKLVVGGGSNNLAFLPGAVLVFNNQKLWKVDVLVEGRELARDFGLRGGSAGLVRGGTFGSGKDYGGGGW